ncbi:hypothetical protein J4E93_003127 [Alternaria ventricosa]|uniref:uncharacterized protein n=1 Tax=Alternaria ventricosa TaxID=1187951 RepID=UPI0020C3FC57|nr:uncharacterized protein J4E93_003127 [Alternaria ventricosa]KAI4650770.1 hypothetical protein J4E93_003127 [Alternaria ventricosa]
MDRSRQPLLQPHRDLFLSSSKKRKIEDPAAATDRMRQRHREEATEMARLTNELAALKRDMLPIAQLNHTIAKQAEELVTLKEENRKWKEEHARQGEQAREMKKAADNARNETNVFRSHLKTISRAHSELYRDIDWQKSKRHQAEKQLQEYLAAQKAIAEKYGSATKLLR